MDLDSSLISPLCTAAPGFRGGGCLQGLFLYGSSRYEVRGIECMQQRL